MSETNAIRTLVRGRKTQNWLAIALVASVLVNIATPVYYSLQAKAKDQVVVFDIASGTLILSPVVDPSDNREILTLCATWAAKSILDRSPAGLENEDLIPILFDVQTARKARDEYSTVKAQYVSKSLRSHVEIKSIDTQPIGNGLIKARVIGQVIITGTMNGESIQEVQPVTLDLSLARNPDLGRNKRYPLMCFAYAYAPPELANK
jgi:hypothetical protein